MLLEKSGSVKRLELQLSKTTIELEIKSAHMESLLQENREVCTAPPLSPLPQCSIYGDCSLQAKIEMGEMRTQYRELESHLNELKAEIVNRDGNEYYMDLLTHVS